MSLLLQICSLTDCKKRSKIAVYPEDWVHEQNPAMEGRISCISFAVHEMEKTLWYHMVKEKGESTLEINKKAFRNLFLGIAGCIFLYWMLHEEERVRRIFQTVSDVFFPFALGACLAFILNVPMRVFERMLRKIEKTPLRRGIALVLTIFVVALVLTLVFWLLIPQISATVQSLIPQMLNFFNKIEKNLMDFLNNNPELLEYVQTKTDLSSFDWDKILEKAVSFVSSSVSTIANGAFSAIGSVAGTLVDVVIGIVFAVYCLFRKEILARQGRRILYALLKERVSDEIVRIMRLTNSTFSNFLSGQCIEVLILGCMFAISMAIFQMPYIPLVSVLVAVTAFIPVVGAFVGCVLGAFFILVDNPIQAVWFVVMFLVIQQIEGNLIYPKVVGNSIGLPGMWVLVAVTVGGELMGIAGMFLMIPLASVLYTLAREFTNARLSLKGIPLEKLQNQPLELKPKFRKKRKQAVQVSAEENKTSEESNS